MSLKINSWKSSMKGQVGYFSRILLAVIMVCTITACAATGEVFVKSTPTSGNGLIYVYRPWRILGSGNAWYLSVNGVRMTTVTNGGYFPFDLKPDNVTFFAKLRPGIGTLLPALIQPEQEMITINVEPSEVYFVKFDHKITGPYMELVDNNTGETEIQGLKMFDAWKE
jgi:hypothetical protein